MKAKPNVIFLAGLGGAGTSTAAPLAAPSSARHSAPGAGAGLPVWDSSPLKCCASGTGIHQTPLVKVPSASLQITGYNSMKSLGNASPCGARGTQQTLELHQNLIHYTGMHHMGNVKCSGTKPSLGVLRTGGAIARKPKNFTKTSKPLCPFSRSIRLNCCILCGTDKDT